MEAAGLVQFQQLFLRIINISVAAAFIAILIVLIYSGIQYITSGGDSKTLASANQAITWALMGILFLVLAWLIIRLISAYTGIDLTQFCIGFPGSDTHCR